MRLIDKPVVKLPVRVLDDHLKKLFADRGLAEMSRVSGAVLECVAQEYLSDDRSQGGIFLAPDACLQFIVLNVEVDRRGPPHHEGQRIQGRPPRGSARICGPAWPVVTHSKKHHVCLTDRRERARDHGARRHHGCTGPAANRCRVFFFRRVGCANVDHGAAGPRLLRQMEETAGVVVDDVESALAGANVEVAVNPDAKGWAADLWPRSAWHKVESAVIALALVK